MGCSHAQKSIVLEPNLCQCRRCAYECESQQNEHGMFGISAMRVWHSTHCC